MLFTPSINQVSHKSFYCKGDFRFLLYLLVFLKKQNLTCSDSKGMFLELNIDNKLIKSNSQNLESEQPMVLTSKNVNCSSFPSIHLIYELPYGRISAVCTLLLAADFSLKHS